MTVKIVSAVDLSRDKSILHATLLQTELLFRFQRHYSIGQACCIYHPSVAYFVKCTLDFNVFGERMFVFQCLSYLVFHALEEYYIQALNIFLYESRPIAYDMNQRDTAQ